MAEWAQSGGEGISERMDRLERQIHRMQNPSPIEVAQRHGEAKAMVDQWVASTFAAQVAKHQQELDGPTPLAQRVKAAEEQNANTKALVGLIQKQADRHEQRLNGLSAWIEDVLKETRRWAEKRGRDVRQLDEAIGNITAPLKDRLTRLEEHVLPPEEARAPQASEEPPTRSQLFEAIGLLTTLHPTMQIDPRDPIGMARKIVAHVRGEPAPMSVTDWAQTPVHELENRNLRERLAAADDMIERAEKRHQRDQACIAQHEAEIEKLREALKIEQAEDGQAVGVRDVRQLIEAAAMAPLANPLLQKLAGIAEQIDKTQYWNAMHRLHELGRELLKRQQEIHRGEPTVMQPPITRQFDGFGEPDTIGPFVEPLRASGPYEDQMRVKPAPSSRPPSSTYQPPASPAAPE